MQLSDSRDYDNYPDELTEKFSDHDLVDDPESQRSSRHNISLESVEAKTVTERLDFPFEQNCFIGMRRCGLAILLILAEEYPLLELLKSVILSVEDQINRYATDDFNSPTSEDLDLFGLIDTQETLFYLGDYRQYEQRKNKLKRRLAEWAPSTYLIQSALEHSLNSDASPALNYYFPLTGHSLVFDKKFHTTIQSKLSEYIRLRNRMVQANIRLVYSVANRFRFLGIAFEDLVQEGHLGLIKAVERFEINKGYRFSTYAHIVISQAIHLAIDKQSSMVRLPFKALREKATVEKTRQTLEQSFGREVTQRELAEILPDSLEYKSLHISRIVKPTADSHMRYAQPENIEHYESLDVEEETMNLHSLSHRDLIERSLTRLSDREAQIVRMRYGVGLSKEYTLEEISLSIGLSRERVRQLAHLAVEKLSRSFAHGV